MPLPDFRPDGWLPEGHFDATWNDVESRFAGEHGSRRRQVFDRLIQWRDELKEKGLTGKLILDGSFISNKPNPSDFDTIFVYDDSCEHILANDDQAKRLIDYSICSTKGFDVLIFARQNTIDSPDWARLDAFDKDKRTGLPKGVLEVVL